MSIALIFMVWGEEHNTGSTSETGHRQDALEAWNLVVPMF